MNMIYFEVRSTNNVHVHVCELFTVSHDKREELGNACELLTVSHDRREDVKWEARREREKLK